MRSRRFSFWKPIVEVDASEFMQIPRLALQVPFGIPSSARMVPFGIPRFALQVPFGIPSSARMVPFGIPRFALQVPFGIALHHLPPAGIIIANFFLAWYLEAMMMMMSLNFVLEKRILFFFTPLYFAATKLIKN